MHDLKVYAMPAIYSASRRILRKYLVKEAVRRADAIISVSNFTKQEIIKPIWRFRARYLGDS